MRGRVLSLLRLFARYPWFVRQSLLPRSASSRSLIFSVFPFPVFSDYICYVYFPSFLANLNSACGLFLGFITKVASATPCFPKPHLSSTTDMDGLSESFARCFSTRPAEEEEISVDEGPFVDPVQNSDRNVVGRLVSQKIFSGHSLKMNINRLIHPLRGFTFQDLGDNKFVLRFNHKMDCSLALEGSPWLIDRCAMVLSPLVGGIDPGSVEVNMMQIVVRLHHLPHHIVSDRVVEQIGTSLGVFMERVTGHRDEMVDFVRIRVKVDVTKALKRGTYLRLRDGSRKWIVFTYERMPMFCFLCGLVGHLEKRCPDRYADNFVDPGPNLPYGDWMKASPAGEFGARVRLPLQPIPSPSVSRDSSTSRGLQVFGFGLNDRDERGSGREKGLRRAE